MFRIPFAWLFAAMFMALVPVTSHAQILEFRCSVDSLTSAQALARLEWARKCALLTNTDGSESFNASKDYRELNTNRLFLGQFGSYSVNSNYAICRYAPTPVYSQFRETSGATIDFWKWSHTVQRPRPLYPIYETTVMAGSGTQLFPSPTLGGCNLYTNKSGTTLYTGSNFYMVAFCESN
ncbi:hypothetical protein [Pyxidicoccus trucidator]|uniref:hypothetical protein n=1 Tax=Pyxidicoccus trucidator TaxID=2709662 RepID=UPI0013D9C62B|nr:hypothetical protein [Pyxidicoccus trucidator]